MLLPAQAPETLDVLNTEYTKAQATWMEAVTAARKAGTAREALPASPVFDFLPRFRALAEKAPASEESGRALLWIYQNERGRDAAENQKLAAAKEALLNQLLDNHAGAAFLAPLARTLARTISYGEEPNLRILKLLAAKNQTAQVRTWVLFGLGAWGLESEKASPEEKAEGRRLIEELIAQHPDSEAAKASSGMLFAADHLKLGDTPPDFETTDVDGVAFKLSDYRGKVVVLDFWGFW